MIGLLNRLVARLSATNLYLFAHARERRSLAAERRYLRGIAPAAAPQSPLRRLTSNCIGDIVGRSHVDPSNPASMPSITPMAIL